VARVGLKKALDRRPDAGPPTVEKIVLMTHGIRSAVVGLFCIGMIELFAPGIVRAHSVTFDFTGAVAAADPHSLGGIMTIPFAHLQPSTISGSFTFDSDTVDANGSTTVGQYNGAIEALSFSVTKPITGDAYQFGFHSTGPLNSIAVNANSTAVNQSYVLSASVQNMLPNGAIVDDGDYFARDFLINLVKPTGNIFATDSLLQTPPSLSPFSLYNSVNNPQGQFRLVFTGDDGDHTIIGNLTSLTVSAVPIPAAVWLFGSGVIGLIGLARRKMRALNT
jgi:hypothetical protein